MTTKEWYNTLGMFPTTQNWLQVPPIGTMVKADYPITCLNPEEIFKVIDIKCETGKFYIRGETTMWFNLSMIHPTEWIRRKR